MIDNTSSGGSDTDYTHEMQVDPATGETIMYVCHGRQCGRHAKYLMDRLKQVQAKGIKVRPHPCVCMGQCENGPNVRVKKKIFNRMNPIKVSDLAKKPM